MVLSTGDQSNISGDVSLSGPIDVSSLPNPVNTAQAIVSYTPTQNTVNVGSSSVTVVAANANRKYILLRNQHLSMDVYIYFGATATLTNGMLLQNGEIYTFPRGFTYTGIITAISANATNKPVLYVEWT